MFGELVGAWLADLWERAGRPANAVYVELGPGRGTLAADALRAMGKAGLTPPVHFVETSPALRAAQAERASRCDLARRYRLAARRRAAADRRQRILRRAAGASICAWRSRAARLLRQTGVSFAIRRRRSSRFRMPRCALAGNLAARLRAAGRRDADRRLWRCGARGRRHAAGGIGAMPMPIRGKRRARAILPRWSIFRRWRG